MLPEIMQWTDHAVNAPLDVAENVLYECIENMNLSAQIIKKECAVGIIQRTGSETKKFSREQLEETVLVIQQIIETSSVEKSLSFCVFNGKLLDLRESRFALMMLHLGGNDIFVDIGNKC